MTQSPVLRGNTKDCVYCSRQHLQRSILSCVKKKGIILQSVTLQFLLVFVLKIYYKNSLLIEGLLKSKFWSWSVLTCGSPILWIILILLSLGTVVAFAVQRHSLEAVSQERKIKANMWWQIFLQQAVACCVLPFCVPCLETSTHHSAWLTLRSPLYFPILLPK